MKYNIDGKECNYINIECNKKEWDNYTAFAVCKGYLYIFPKYADKIVKVDLKTGEIKWLGKLYSEIYNQNNHLYSKEDFAYFVSGCQMENIMWLFQNGSNNVIAYNMEDDTWKKYICLNICDCIHVTCKERMLYILSSEGRIYRWNMSDQCPELFVDCSHERTGDHTFSQIVVTNKNLFLLPSLGKDIFMIDISTRKIEVYDDYPEEFKYCGPENWNKYYGCCEDSEFYYFAMRSTNLILSISKRNGTIGWVKPEHPLCSDYLKAYVNYNRDTVSEKVCGLEGWLTNLDVSFRKSKEDSITSLGYRIWKQMQMIQ